SARLSISVDGRERLSELLCDGVLVATPAGSTAYNLSAGGPILPLKAPLLALTPISPFRPRRWRGALLPNKAHVKIEVQEADKRPVSAVADHTEFRNVLSVSIREEPGTVLKVSFCWFFLCLSALDCAAGETRTILILDATAQMSAQFGQQRKIDAMKSA